MCCSTVRVTLNGVVKDKHGSKAGTYQKASGLINNRSYWNKIDGEYALWWDIIVNSWTNRGKGTPYCLRDVFSEYLCSRS